MSHTAALKILSPPGVPGCEAPAAGGHLEEGHGEAPGLHQVHLSKVFSILSTCLCQYLH